VVDAPANMAALRVDTSDLSCFTCSCGGAYRVLQYAVHLQRTHNTAAHIGHSTAAQRLNHAPSWVTTTQTRQRWNMRRRKGARGGGGGEGTHLEGSLLLLPLLLTNRGRDGGGY
jgi:hypothetical protein